MGDDNGNKPSIVVLSRQDHESSQLDCGTGRDDLKQGHRTQKAFFPGSIHAEEVRDFWQTELKAVEWVMETLKEGYVIPFINPPPFYEEPNNSSAKKDMEFVYQAVEKLKELGIIEFRDEKPHCVSPLTVSIKMDSHGAPKKRMCWDGSRCVNLLY